MPLKKTNQASKIMKYVLLVSSIAIIAGLFMAFGPPQLMAKTETPEFCKTCHVMELHYESWFSSGVHRNIKCVDCHLPNNNAVQHYLWKGITGTNDIVVFCSGMTPEKINTTNHGINVIQANCIRCHEEMVSRIDNERKCWQCHRKLFHEDRGIFVK